MWHFCARMSVQHDFGNIHNPWIPHKPYILTISQQPCHAHAFTFATPTYIFYKTSSIGCSPFLLSLFRWISNLHQQLHWTRTTQLMTTCHKWPNSTLSSSKRTQSCQTQNYHTRTIDQIIRWQWNCLTNSSFVCALLSIHHSSDLFFPPAARFSFWPRSNI